MTDTGNMLTAIAALIEVKRSGILPEGVDRDVLVQEGLAIGVSGWKLTARGEAWLAMIAETPLPVQQWIDPREADRPFVVNDPIGFREKLKYFPPEIQAQFAEPATPKPDLPPLPDGFTSWGGVVPMIPNPQEGATGLVKGLPPGLDPSSAVQLFQRNGKVRTVQGNSRFYAGQVDWAWAKEPVYDPMQDVSAAKKARDRYERRRGEDVIGFMFIPDKDDSLRRDI